VIFSRQTIYLHNSSENITDPKSNSKEVSHNIFLLKKRVLQHRLWDFSKRSTSTLT